MYISKNYCMTIASCNTISGDVHKLAFKTGLTNRLMSRQIKLNALSLKTIPQILVIPKYETARAVYYYCTQCLIY